MAWCFLSSSPPPGVAFLLPTDKFGYCHGSIFDIYTIKTLWFWEVSCCCTGFLYDASALCAPPPPFLNFATEEEVVPYILLWTRRYSTPPITHLLGNFISIMYRSRTQSDEQRKERERWMLDTVVIDNTNYICPLRIWASMCSAVSCPGNLCTLGLNNEYPDKLPRALVSNPIHTNMVKKHVRIIHGPPKSTMEEALAMTIHPTMPTQNLSFNCKSRASNGSGTLKLSLRYSTVLRTQGWVRVGSSLMRKNMSASRSSAKSSAMRPPLLPPALLKSCSRIC